MFQFKGLPKQGVDILQEEVEVFEVENNGNIGKDAKYHKGFFGSGLPVAMLHCLGQQKIPQDAAADDWQVGRVEIPIKPEGHAD